MAIRAVVSDTGGVPEIAPDLGVTRRWEARPGPPAGGLDERMRDDWAGGSIDTFTEDEMAIADIDKLLTSAWVSGSPMRPCDGPDGPVAGGCGLRGGELVWRQAEVMRMDRARLLAEMDSMCGGADGCRWPLDQPCPAGR